MLIRALTSTQWRSTLEVRISRASAVVVQQIPPTRAEWFMEWQRGVSEAAESFVGYRGALMSIRRRTTNVTNGS